MSTKSMNRNYNNTKYISNKKSKEDDSFMDLNSLQSVKIMDEINMIDNTLVSLQETIQQYIDDSIEIWNEHLKTFIQSSDCNTLQFMFERDMNKFIIFMTTQKSYRLMMIAKLRLNKRKEYLMHQI